MIKNFKQFLNESFHSSSIKAGDKVNVVMSYFENSPSYEVIAYNDSNYNDHLECESFSYKMGGDMMMIARFDKETNTWISN